MKNQHFDLGAETVAFVRSRLMEVVGENPENLQKVECNMKEVKEQIFRLFYDLSGSSRLAARGRTDVRYLRHVSRPCIRDAKKIVFFRLSDFRTRNG